MTDLKISVIIPIYNVQNFIKRCACSLFEQTMCDGVEFIFVNDATPDKSMEILYATIKEYPERKGQIAIIEHHKNKGLPAARNTGLKAAKGEYIFHCDSDDFLDRNALENMFLAAKKAEADIVWCDWYLSYKKKERYMKQPEYLTPIEALKGMLSGTMKYNVWNKIAKRELYELNNITFPDGYGMGEDMTMICLFSYAKKIAYIPRAFYHYVKLNNNAFSQTYSNKHLMELRHNVKNTLTFLENKYGDELKQEYGFFKLDIKYPFLITDNYNKYKLWEEWFPEANKYIQKNRNVSVIRRIIQLLADKRQYWLICIYYKLAYKFIYRIIFN